MEFEGWDRACPRFTPPAMSVIMMHVPFEEVMPLLALMLCQKRKCNNEWNLHRDSRIQKTLSEHGKIE
jgi:hypothetical protein